MTKIKSGLLALSILGLNACAHDPSAKDIKAQCRLEMDAARTAVQLREQGKDKQSMLATLPPLYPDSTRPLRQLYRIVGEVYDGPQLNDVVFGIYHFEYCVRQLQHRPVPEHYTDIAPQLKNCQLQYDRHGSKQAVACVRNVFARHAAVFYR